MKKTRLLTWILAVVLIVASIALVACVDKPQVTQLAVTLPQLKDDQMAVVIKNGDDDYTCYAVTLTDELKTGEDVVDYLQNELALEVDWQESTYGKYVNGIGGAKVRETNEYVAIFTSVTSDKSTGADVLSYQIGDVIVSYAGVGISDMKTEYGAIFYFEIQTF